jgi:YidC/Oxa1 family membrane protein insertase
VSWDTVNYVGVDTPYFSSILIPLKTPEVKWFYQVQPILVGALPTDQTNRELHHENPRLANTSCQITSKTAKISRDEPLKHQYQLFAGPKQRDLLVQYTAPASTYQVDLAELIYYGWQIWAWFAKPLSHLLHFFAMIPGVNYGLAIILLTVLVRLCMFPMSRKQALGAQKMQLLAPEMKKINEKYKNELEKKHKAMQELYRKHNYNPLSGCLPMFIQLPIFIGLYRALAVNIELRQAPLISDAFGWATNLAAPDMLFRWSGFMPSFIVSHMGPYFNLLPVLTVILFIWQQKMFMPPPADENAALQQKMMQYMMIFMGYMFFTVPSGLCIYFIASSLWGIAERKLLPKTQAAAAGADAASPAAPAAVASGQSPAEARRRQRRNRK